MFEVTVDLPTPPLPDEMATIELIPSIGCPFMGASFFGGASTFTLVVTFAF